MIIFEIIFWICIGALLHSYLLYPLLLKVISLLKKNAEPDSFHKNDDLPSVSILMAVFNEEKVLEKKIESIFTTTYPDHKIELFIGSDNSTDRSNDILKNLQTKYNFKYHLFKERQGKIKIINQLFNLAEGEIVIITDANVLFENETLFELIRYLKDSSIGLVDTRMRNYGLKKDGISIQEKSYISREVWIKNLESTTSRRMIGPFGGCYALRKELFSKVPENYLVDDFFICMKVIEQNMGCINNLNACVYEDVSNILAIEFKRKTRIAVGNFQNLSHFKRLLCSPFSATAFNFFSHKVLRWLGPFWILGMMLCNIVLAVNAPFYQFLLLGQIVITFLPLIDIILKKIKIHIVPLRFATYFYTVNLSLLVGLFKYIKGVKSNVWKPTSRFQG